MASQQRDERRVAVQRKRVEPQRRQGQEGQQIRSRHKDFDTSHQALTESSGRTVTPKSWISSSAWVGSMTTPARSRLLI
jgi:hypothetical protein